MSENTVQSQESIDLNIGRYLLVLKRRCFPAISVFAAAVILSALSTTLIKPSYEAKGKLLFKSPSFNAVGSNLLPSNAEGTETGDLRPLVATQNPISSQIEVISSPTLSQMTIDELHLKNQKGELLKVEEFRKSLSLKIIGGTDVLQVSYKSRSPEEAAAVVNKIMNLYLENDILTSRSEAESTRQFMAKLLPRIQAAVHRAEVELRIFKQKNNVVDLSEEAKTAVANIGNLDNQIYNLRAELDQTTAQTNQLRQKVGLDLQQASAVSALSQSPAVQGILTQLQDTERQLATQRSLFFDSNPTIVDLKAKQAKLQTLLQQQIEQTIGRQTKFAPGMLQIGELRQSLIRDFLLSDVQRRSLEQKLASLYNSRSVYEQRAEAIPRLVQNQQELEQRLEVAQSTYQTLLKKVQELQVAENKNTADARIIAQALVPEKPILSRKLIVLALGLMLGTFLSTSTVLVLELKDRSLKTPKEVREAFGYPVLGVIPLATNKVRSHHENAESKTQEIAVRDNPNSQTSEIYRMIQANLKFLRSDKRLNTIVVTSAAPKEGKSTVSANLAAAIAQLGRKVLLIDADMRVPSQHLLWQLKKAAGLSEVLVGQAPFNKTACQVMDNLDVLPAGFRPPNPLALLDSRRMASLLVENFSSQYDFVIIDAPPLLLAADALTLSQMADGILLVARPGIIDSKSADAAQELLERSGNNILGLVVNGGIRSDLKIYERLGENSTNPRLKNILTTKLL